MIGSLLTEEKPERCVARVVRIKICADSVVVTLENFGNEVVH